MDTLGEGQSCHGKPHRRNLNPGVHGLRNAIQIGYPKRVRKGRRYSVHATANLEKAKLQYTVCSDHPDKAILKS